MTRIVFTSDCHGKLEKITLPKGDILVLAGDILPNFSRDPYWDRIKQERALSELDHYLGTLGFKHIIFVAGNHDWIMDQPAEWNKLLKNITYLQDQELVIDGIKFYGSPWQPEFCNWAFNLPRKGLKLKQVWDAIPSDVDILVTHGPAWGHLDRIVPWPKNGIRVSDNLGCELLFDRLKDGAIKPKIHAFGHIHGSYGIKQLEHTLFLNSALCNENYDPVNPPHVVDYDAGKVTYRY